MTNQWIHILTWLKHGMLWLTIVIGSAVGCGLDHPHCSHWRRCGRCVIIWGCPLDNLERLHRLRDRCDGSFFNHINIYIWFPVTNSCAYPVYILISSALKSPSKWLPFTLPIVLHQYVKRDPGHILLPQTTWSGNVSPLQKRNHYCLRIFSLLCVIVFIVTFHCILQVHMCIYATSLISLFELCYHGIFLATSHHISSVLC